MNIQLLGTSGCHLCDEAEHIVARALKGHNIEQVENNDYQLIDIMDNDALYDEYQLTIPTIIITNNQNNIKLLWPFTLEEVLHAFSIATNR
jgi:hypothetical protein